MEGLNDFTLLLKARLTSKLDQAFWRGALAYSDDRMQFHDIYMSLLWCITIPTVNNFFLLSQWNFHSFS